MASCSRRVAGSDCAVRLCIDTTVHATHIRCSGDHRSIHWYREICCIRTRSRRVHRLRGCTCTPSPFYSITSFFRPLSLSLSLQVRMILRRVSSIATVFSQSQGDLFKRQTPTLDRVCLLLCDLHKRIRQAHCSVYNLIAVQASHSYHMMYQSRGSEWRLC